MPFAIGDDGPRSSAPRGGRVRIRWFGPELAEPRRIGGSGAIEEKVGALARRKAALFNGVMDDGDLFAGSITADDIRGLLG